MTEVTWTEGPILNSSSCTLQVHGEPSVTLARRYGEQLRVSSVLVRWEWSSEDGATPRSSVWVTGGKEWYSVHDLEATPDWLRHLISFTEPDTQPASWDRYDS